MKRVILSIVCLLWSTALFNHHAGYAKTKDITITINVDGFNPSKITVEKGKAARLVFIRKTDKTCATKVLIPDLNINRELPLNKPVVINIQPEKSGVIGFACPMKMLKGEMRVTEKK